jgi:hypothetical protein
LRDCNNRNDAQVHRLAECLREETALRVMAQEDAETLREELREVLCTACTAPPDMHSIQLCVCIADCLHAVYVRVAGS